MADMTTGTGADSREDIKDEPALASVGIDPDTPVATDAAYAQADAEEPGQDDEDEDDFDDDDDAEDDEEEEDDDDAQQASEEPE
jgi:hypothetical protein